MALKKRGPAAAVTASATQVLAPTVSLGAAYGRVIGFQARNWASSAKAAAGTDAAIRVQLADADGVVFFLDAADVDYKTARVDVAIAGQDDTATGLGVASKDATGTAATAAAGGFHMAKSPVTVTVSNAGTATDYFEIYLNVEI